MHRRGEEPPAPRRGVGGVDDRRRRRRRRRPPHRRTRGESHPREPGALEAPTRRRVERDGGVPRVPHAPREAEGVIVIVVQ